MHSEAFIRLTLVGGVTTFLLGAVSVFSVPVGTSGLAGDPYVSPEVVRATTLAGATEDQDSTTDSANKDGTTTLVVTSSDDGATDNVYLEPTKEDDTSQSYTFTTEVTETTLEYVSCPFPHAKGRVIIDYTLGGSISIRDLSIEANSTLRAAQRSTPTSLTTGVYKVSLASFAHRGQPLSERGPRERWRLELFDGAALKVAESKPIRDILDDETLVIELVDTALTVSAPSVKAVAMHHAYPTSVANRFAPLCAALDRVGDIPEQQIIQDEKQETKNEIKDTPSESKDVATYRNCPLPPRDGRIIIDLTRGGTTPVEKLVIQADGDRSQAVLGPVMTFIPRGSYEVRHASYSGTIVGSVSGSESWYAVLTDAEGSVVTRTPASRDIPDWQDEFVSKVDQPVDVLRDITRLTAVHAAYPSRDSHRFAPLCISFDPVGSTTVQKPSTTEDVERVSGTETPDLPESINAEQVADKGQGMTTEISIGTEVIRARDIGLRDTDTPIRAPDTSIVPRQTLVNELGTVDLLDTLSRAPLRERIVILERLLSLASDAAGDEVEVPPRGERVQPRFERQVGTIVSDPVEVEYQRSRLNARQNELRLIDSDGDGISDYDEIYLYGTDPYNPFTGGGLLSDGERVLMGLDPTTDSLESIVVQSPVDVDLERHHPFTIDEIAYADDGIWSVDTVRPFKIRGSAEPHMFITLYIYSMPVVVTVRSDAQGRFEYVHTEHLPDGSHQIFVATVNGSGAILANSAPFSIVKTAEAIELIPPTPADSPVERSLRMMLTLAFLLILFAAISSVVLIGMRRTDKEVTEAHSNVYE